MTKRTALIVRLIVLTLCLAMGILIALSWLGSVSYTSVHTTSGDAILEMTFDSETLKKIVTDVTFEDLVLESSADDTLLVRITGPQNQRYTPPTVTEENDTLRIQSRTKTIRGILINQPWWTITVSVPQMQLESVRLQTSSGDVRNEIAADICEIQTSSGDVTGLSNGKTIAITTSSGEINLQGTYETATLNTSSGDISVGGQVDTLKTATNSGDQQLVCAATTLTAESSSGDIGAHLQSNAAAADISTSSGDIHVALKDVADYSVTFRSNSGDFRDRLDKRSAEHKGDYTVGNGTLKLTLETSSGDVTIQ